MLGGFLPAYLTARGTSVADAAFTVSIGIMVSLVSVPLGGYLATRYLNSEDLIEEIRLKKMKLHVKDEMERIARIHGARARHSQ